MYLKTGNKTPSFFEKTIRRKVEFLQYVYIPNFLEKTFVENMLFYKLPVF